MNVRNIALLAVSQALNSSGISMVVLLGAIVSSTLMPDRSWATLPQTAMIAGTALATIPAALLMQRIGRRLGFIAGSLAAFTAALLAGYGILSHSFILFVLGTLLIGVNGAFVGQYRFAAAESVESSLAGKAISIVLLGGMAAGFLGPLLGRLGRDWLPVEYVGSFAGLAVMYLAASVFLSLFRNPIGRQQEMSGPERPLREVVMQPDYLRAVWTATVAYAVMTFIMTAAPISMHMLHGFDLASTALVIQSHVIAMYLPSVFSGYLIDRLGSPRMQALGVLSMLACVMLALLAPSLLTYWTALVLLGLGWNLLFVGATVSLTRTYSPRERFKAQALNDFVLFAVQGAAALASGPVIFGGDWQMQNLLMLPFLLVTLTVVLLPRRASRRTDVQSTT